MARRCEKCGRPFARLKRTSPAGVQYAVSGCPECLDDAETIEAFDAIADAAAKMHMEVAPPPEPRAHGGQAMKPIAFGVRDVREIAAMKAERSTQEDES